MEYLLSKFGGELQPMDRKYPNALHAYPESQKELLDEHKVPICGNIDLKVDKSSLDLICIEQDYGNLEHSKRRRELGFNIKALGPSLDFKTTNFKEKLQDIQSQINSQYNMQLPLEELFKSLEFDANLYFLSDDRLGVYDNIVWFAHENDSVDDIVNHVKEYDHKYGNMFYFPDLLVENKIGEVSNINLRLFETLERGVFNSLREIMKTRPSIIFPEHSKYYHFWTDKYLVKNER